MAVGAVQQKNEQSEVRTHATFVTTMHERVLIQNPQPERSALDHSLVCWLLCQISKILTRPTTHRHKCTQGPFGRSDLRDVYGVMLTLLGIKSGPLNITQRLCTGGGARRDSARPRGRSVV